VKQHLTSISLSLLATAITACSTTPHWEERYEHLRDPIVQEYEAVASGLDNTLLNYQVNFELEPASRSSNDIVQMSVADVVPSFVLHAHYSGGAANLAELDAAAQAELAQQVVSLQGLKQVKIQVIGHTDSRPISPRSQVYFPDNQALSVARAKVVADHLQALLPNAEISYSGMADSLPVADNSTVAGQAQNRRVEVSVQADDTPDMGNILSIQSMAEPEAVPSDYQPWWRPLVKKPFNTASQPTYATMTDLFVRTIEHSNQIKVFSDLPLIRKTAIDEAEGRFDMHAFVEALYREEDEPIGSTLQTGFNQGRFEEHEWYLKGGVRKPLVTGGEVELSQRIGELDNNSQYLIPHDQGHARLALSFRQPLLNGSGIEYNESTIEIAKVDHEIATDEFVRQVEAHLLETYRAYWGLYLERANLLQKKKLLSETQKVTNDLEARLGIDTLESELQTAKSTLAMRNTDSIRAEQAVRNAEGKLLALINDPNLVLNNALEIIPNDTPFAAKKPVEIRTSVQTALKNRPEVKQAFKQLKAGVIRLQMAEKEVLPILDFVFEGYLAGLEGNNDYQQAVDNEFNIGGPGYSVGLLFDMPLDNQAAKARQRRRQLEVRQLISQLRTTMDTVMLEVQVSVREVDTAFREFNSAYQAMQARHARLSTLQDRRGLSTSDENYLQRLLDAQAELADSEHTFMMSYIAYNISMMNLQRAEGNLLKISSIEMVEEVEEDSLEGEDLPVLKLKRTSEEPIRF